MKTFLKEYWRPLLVLILAVLGFILLLVLISTNTEQKKVDQATYLQECLERTTDTGWCYQRAFNLDLGDE